MKLREALVLFGTNRWVELAEKVGGGYTARDCYSQWYSASFDLEIPGRWPVEQEAKLLLYVFSWKPDWITDQTVSELCQAFDQASSGAASSAVGKGSHVRSLNHLRKMLRQPQDVPGDDPPKQWPKRGFWHKVALALDEEYPNHPAHCKSHFYKLMQGAKVRTTLSVCERNRTRTLPLKGADKKDILTLGNGREFTAETLNEVRQADTVMQYLSSFLSGDAKV
ncbi:hypothetical protein IWQ60_011780 [Tieghemiomyces parasiticus]|uniref:Uncharacterized protein n=1 Tax=Tieghemiomyces parasiticus TaxID=78921 RepID=A0A9W8DLY4_9FUNG|nr:hypothetical protein IWQ60_011780 [Tieghemiomyces parasiticus]